MSNAHFKVGQSCLFGQLQVAKVAKNYSTRMGFEPTRAEPIGLAVQRLNHSATSSCHCGGKCAKKPLWTLLGNKENQKYFPRRELNPGLLGESQLS